MEVLIPEYAFNSLGISDYSINGHFQKYYEDSKPGHCVLHKKKPAILLQWIKLLSSIYNQAFIMESLYNSVCKNIQLYILNLVSQHCILTVLYPFC